jgi:hypothetical protein
MTDHLARHPSRPEDGLEVKAGPEVNGLESCPMAVAAIKTFQETNRPHINKKKKQKWSTWCQIAVVARRWTRCRGPTRTHDGADPALGLRHGP